MDQAACEANGCVYVQDLDGEVECEAPELEAGEVAEPDEAAEDAAEAGISHCAPNSQFPIFDRICR